MSNSYDPTQPFLGSVLSIGNAGPGATFAGTYRVINAAPAGLANPFLGKVQFIAAPAGAANPSLGQVVIVGAEPAGAPDTLLGTAAQS